MNDLLGRFFGQEGNGWPSSHLPEAFSRGHIPSVNISENDKVLTIAVDLPGVNSEDVDIQVIGNDLVIAGERKWEEKKQEKDFLRAESQFGAFRRVVPLPPNLRSRPEDIEATFKNGILEICLKKVEAAPDVKVNIKVK
jgi:HSP20 family protein